MSTTDNTRNTMNRILISLVALTLAAPPTAALAQDEPPAAAEAAQSERPQAERNLYEFSTAGFDFDLELPFEPVIRESNNKSIYAVTIQRRAADGLAFGTDGLMAYIRLTQTIDPIDEIGTLADLDQATVDSTIRSIRSAFGDDNRLATSECSMEILGELRAGKRIDVGLLENGTSVYAECYTFTNEGGNGVTLTIKYLDPIGDEIPNDVLVADQFLASLVTKPLTPETHYTFSMAGYPIRIPLRSQIQQGKRINEFVVDATIAYQYGSLRVQTILLPKDADDAAAIRAQYDGFAGALNQQARGGQIELLWSNPVSIPAGSDADAVITGMSYGVRRGGEDFVSNFFVARDDRTLLVANFSGSNAFRPNIAGYAEQFYARPLTTASSPEGSDYLGEFTLSRPRGLNLIRTAGGSFVYAAQYAASSSGDSVLAEAARAGYSVIRQLEGDNTELSGLLAGSFPPGSTLAAEIETDASGRMTMTAELPDNSGESLALSATGWTAPAQDDLPAIFYASVSASVVHDEQLMVTETLSGRVSPNEKSGSINLNFGTLQYNPSHAFVERSNPRGVQDDLKLTTAAGDSARIHIESIDESDRQLEGEDLAKAYLLPRWKTQSASDDLGGSMAAGTVAGHPALLMDSTMSNGSYQRVMGFRFEDAYVSVLFTLPGGRDEGALKELMSMLHGQ